MEHFSFTKTLDGMTSAHWGGKYGSEEDAQRHLINNPEKMAAVALLELIRRFNLFINTLQDGRAGYCQPSRIKKPEDAKAFPDKQVGEFVWSGSVDDGFGPDVIIGKDDEGFLLIIQAGFCTECTPRVRFASSDEYATLQEALIAGANREESYSAPRAARAQEILAAVKAGSDLEKYCDRFEED